MESNGKLKNTVRLLFVSRIYSLTNECVKIEKNWISFLFSPTIFINFGGKMFPLLWKKKVVKNRDGKKYIKAQFRNVKRYRK